MNDRHSDRDRHPARLAFGALAVALSVVPGPVGIDAMHVFAAPQDAVDIYRQEQKFRDGVGATLMPARATPARVKDCRMGVVEKKGRRLSTLDAWFDRAGPKGGDLHWKDGRSAKESAKSWLAAAPALPAEIAATLSSHRDIGTLCDWRAEPEAQVRIDEFRGEPPNVDVLLVGSDRSGPLVVAVEAKADEPFGATVGENLRDARLRLHRNPRSRGVARIERLLAALFDTTTNDRDALELRYQLLTVTAAAMAEAGRRSAQRAVVMVHEFATSLTTDDRRASNAHDLDRFVARLAGRRSPVEPGALLGPFRVPGKPIVDAPIALYFGKAVAGER